VIITLILSVAALANTPEIPNAFRGHWNDYAAQCRDPYSPHLMKITRNQILAYELNQYVENIVYRSKNDITLATFDRLADGRKINKLTFILTLSADGKSMKFGMPNYKPDTLHRCSK